MTQLKSIFYLATASLSGLLFGAGLYVSQMTDAYKVLRFLDFGAIPAGGWDPSLGLVIVAAIGVMFIAVRMTRQKTRPLFNGEFHTPAYTKIDAQLVIGAALFGIGWGMSGICPGPAITLIGFMPQNLLVFLAAMFAGSLAGAYIPGVVRNKRLQAA